MQLFELGELNEKELEAAKRRIEEANCPHKDMKMYEIAVAVYVNGTLQYHGGQTVGVANGGALDRRTMKQVVHTVVQDIDPNGEVK